ncbi:MAG: heme-copper oxidase subunit III [bacterium]|nr:heme-copper oxidase subunit III [bacterium]
MNDRNVVALRPGRRPRGAFLKQGIVSMLIFLIFDAMILAGMVGAFMLTRLATGDAWPPVGQPWFPPVLMVSTTVVLLASGVLVFLAARAWENREPRTGPLLLSAIALGVSFLLCQGAAWVTLFRRGLVLSSVPQADLFYLVAATHAVHVIGGLIFLAVAWRRLRPPREGQQPRGLLSTSGFLAVRILWYFVVGVWPALYLCLYI